MKVFFGIAVILILANAGSYALKCYTCSGTGNSCKSGSKTCSAGNDRCGKLVVKAENGDERVSANCSSKAGCDVQEALCKIAESSPQVKKCGVYCCTGDNCNLSPKTSQVILAVLVVGLLAATLLN